MATAVCLPDTRRRLRFFRTLSQKCVLQTLDTEVCPPDTCHRSVSSRHLSQKCVLQTLVLRTLLVMQFPPKARSIPASERVASATLWAHGRFQHAGRPICAFVCMLHRVARSLPPPAAHHGVAARKDSHLTAPPRPDERPGQGRSSSRMCDTEQRHKYYVYSYI